MANVIKKAINRWTKGLVMDFSPENTRNEVLTHALNATLLTFNGNEMSLQNDMGNARVETAYLPEGYIPVGTCEYGGIIYIVSYNPLEDKSQIGCFPSPERNISSDELGESTETSITFSDFQKTNSNGELTGELKNISKYVLLKNDKLNPGDKFIIYANESISDEQLVGLEKFNGSKFEPASSNPILALNIVSIEDSGKITYLNSDVINYEYQYNNTYRYHILGKSVTGSDNTLSTPDLDAYRNVLSSGYSVFKSKTSGKLAILAELIAIDSYSVTHRVEEVKDVNGQIVPDKYNIILYPEISCEETNKKYGITPKLSYYYLEESNLKLRLNTNSPDSTDYVENGIDYRPLFINTLQRWNINTSFINTKLSDIFNVTELDPSHTSLTLTQLYSQYYTGVEYTNPFYFYQPETYHEKVFDIQNDEYNAINLGSIVLPENTNGVNQPQSYELPLVYKYTIVPCMNYGKLQNLAVSNTIDFLNINNFSASKFNVWKYRVDGPTIHLQFGAEIYDTHVSPVSALVFEFYDLWGFAGSIIIDNKKAYSGTFTKILTLNTIGQLSNKKVPFIQNIGDQNTGNYNTIYQRNINTIQNYALDTCFLNEQEIKFDNDIGWRTIDDKDIENDCGTLYPNLIYGVKAYFVQEDPNDPSQKTFTFKDQFFMFTNPLFNDYYYIQNNFNNLNNPELDFVFVSRIKDSSSKENLSYTNGSLTIENGYKSGSKIEEYTKGSSTETNIHDTKYYKYKGTSELQLEIGLKKDYENIGLSYDRGINKYFSCDLTLINKDNTGSWSVESDSDITDKNILLNYSEDDLKNDPNLNSLQFSNSTNTLKIDYNTLQDYHFLDPNDQSGSFIPIKYEFVVGYSVTIDDIRDTQVPATTVCALCHKRDDGTYNYEDFGIEEIQDEDGNPIYLSTTIFYNTGTNTTVEFGLCRQIQSNGNALEQCQEIIDSDHEAVGIQTPGRLNAGSPLQNVKQYIGKLSFCEPHLSGFSDKNGVSVSPDSTNNTLWVNPYLGDYIDDYNSEHNFTYGCAPSNNLYTNPKYLMCLNTKNMINRYSEFPVTMDRVVSTTSTNTIFIGISEDNKTTPVKFKKAVPARKFVGLSGKQLVEFNKKLLQTMKQIYAYNPDYNSLIVKTGDVSVLDNKLRFTSNIIAENASIDFSKDNKTLNEFIAIGNMSFSSYFTNLNKHSKQSVLIKESNGKWRPQINFTENMDYCGGNNNKALISNLVYNTPDISDLYNELSLVNDSITIRHENGDLSSIKGDLNTKTLYGYKSDTNQLIQLDVSNYSIDSNGSINLGSQVISIDTQMSDSQLYWDDPTSLDIQIGNTTLQLTHNIYLMGGVETCASEENGMYTIVQNNVQIQPRLNINNTNPQCKVSIDKVELGIDCDCLNETYTDCNDTEQYTSPVLQGNDYNGIYNFLTGGNTEEYACVNGLHNHDYNVSIYHGHNGTNNKLIGKSVTLQQNDVLQIDADNIGEPANIILLVHFTLKSIDLHIEYTNEMQQPSDESSIVNITPTTNYFNFNKNTYAINDSYASTTIRGTNVTINDLVYEPNPDGHRLYMRHNCFTYQNSPRAQLYYRTLTADTKPTHGVGLINDSWKGDYSQYNRLYINTGPCFIPDNLS